MQEKRVINGCLGKKAQTTIFIIIAVVIVVAAVLIILFWPKVKNIVVTKEISPSSYITECVSPVISEAIALVSKQGGSVRPLLTVNYAGDRIEYLCYTNEYYKTCVMQQPMLKQHIEYEIVNFVKPKVEKCFNSLVSELEKRNYRVDTKRPDVSIEIKPDNIVVYIKTEMSVRKGESVERYDRFRLNVRSGLYSLVMISSNILNWESRYGGSDPLTYMLYHPNLKVEKYEQEDGTTIYILSDRDTLEQFKFATRSLAWPAGYGIG